MRPNPNHRNCVQMPHTITLIARGGSCARALTRLTTHPRGQAIISLNVRGNSHLLGHERIEQLGEGFPYPVHFILRFVAVRPSDHTGSNKSTSYRSFHKALPNTSVGATLRGHSSGYLSILVCNVGVVNILHNKLTMNLYYNI